MAPQVVDGVSASEHTRTGVGHDEGSMKRLILVLQILLGVYFIAIGVMHFVVPDGLPDQLSWMYDLPTWLHVVAGVAEIAGGLGLILPTVTGIRPQLTPLAALGLALVMVGAIVYHAGRGEGQSIVVNVVLAALLSLVAWFRSR
jgi:uncharacterized membrane protein